ncbi:hypothetical protein GE09DRAFT_1107785 [Coniochaeta sp. 2T2.1]|nr:hypothetical protein GE09DRAFT_1107785 [Coniochaeta sp. 2T2.1]
MASFLAAARRSFLFCFLGCWSLLPRLKGNWKGCMQLGVLSFLHLKFFTGGASLLIFGQRSRRAFSIELTFQIEFVQSPSTMSR